MYSSRSFPLTEGEFNYLLPVLNKRLHQSSLGFWFIANDVLDLEDMLNRLKGYYDKYDELENMVSYRCYKDKSLIHFRESIGASA
jgi:hypothetical protein